MLVALFSATGTVRGECSESIVIDSVSYRVGAPWCGNRLDSANVAQPSELVRLPDSLTFEDYRIYVTPETRRAFVAMATHARRDSVELTADSGFRSPSFQRRLIARRLAEGREFSEIIKNVAPPGYSQHHTGRALDLVPSDPSFARSRKYRWLREHATEYGFVESYSEDFEGGMHWEPWHWLYIGTPDPGDTNPGHDRP